ncbi:hypothetical protein JD844_006968, partial [Phrynosoma platyrhinos]
MPSVEQGVLKILSIHIKPTWKYTLTRLIKRQLHINNPEFLKEVLLYETGFLVCAAIGVLFIILVPLVGLFFCCCRCCGHCGGFLYQKQTKHTGCRRTAFFVSVLAVTIILLAGDICAYISNQRISQTVGRGFSTLNSTVHNLHIYLESIPQEIDMIINTSSIPLNQANDSLLNIGPTLGKKIKTQLGEQANKALDAADHLLRVIGSVEQELKEVNRSSSRLQILQKELDRNLTILRNNINKTLNDCGVPCQNVSVQNLKPGANLSTVPDVTYPLQLITNLTRSDPNATLTEARKTLENIPEKVSNQTKTVVSDAQAKLHHIKKQIDAIRSNFSMLNFLKNVSDLMNDIIKKANTYEPEVVTYDGYRWIVGVVLCCLVLLIIVLNVFGLVFGALGLDPQEMPTQRSCLSNSGGLFLMASVGICFIFAWLLMLLVLVTFLIGGNTYTLVCRPWANGRLLEFLETPDLFPELNVTKIMNLNVSDVTLSSMYKSCENNASLWNTLHLNEAISLDEILNISKYTNDIDSTLNKINVSVGSTDFLNDDQKRLMQDLSKKNGLLKLDFADALAQINQNMTNQDLSALAAKLDTLATKSHSPDISANLQNQAAEMKKIQAWMNDNFPPEIHVLNSSIRSLQKSLPQIPVSSSGLGGGETWEDLVNSTLLEVEAAEEFMRKKTGEIIKNATLTFVNSVLGYFESYVDWVKSNIKEEVGRCGPAAWTVDSMNTVFCGYIVDSLNAFWFSLGWCTVFLLPNIILAVKLAKFYRRMYMDDFYVDDATETMELACGSSYCSNFSLAYTEMVAGAFFLSKRQTVEDNCIDSQALLQKAFAKMKPS